MVYNRLNFGLLNTIFLRLQQNHDDDVMMHIDLLFQEKHMLLKSLLFLNHIYI